MTNGWTGGQYSLYRAVFGVYLVVHALGLLPRDGLSTALVAVGTISALFLLVGLYDRAAALVVCVVLAWICLRDTRVASPSLAFAVWLLLAHASLPRAPYGSWAARGRVDPAGGWHMPTPNRTASWVVIVMGCGWVVTTWMRAGRVTFADPWAFFPGAAFLLLFAFNPAWVPPRWSERRDQIFYDGTCGFCHRATRFVVSEDRLETSFAFAPLQGDTCAAAIGLTARGGVPDSLLVKTEEGSVLARSDAVIYVLERLGGAWRVIAVIMRLVPKGLRDTVYDIGARVRYRVFGRTETLCPILPAHLRSRFHD